MRGIYLITYRGQSDWGLGLLHLAGETITGADVGGSLYDGTFVDTPLELKLNIILRVPPGVALVTGAPPQPFEQTFPFSVSIEKKAIDLATPQLVQTPTGPVNVIIRKLRDLPVG